MISSLVTPPLYPPMGTLSSPFKYPLRGTHVLQNGGMKDSLRHVLALNLAARMTALGKVQEDLGPLVSQSSVSRILKEQTPVNLDLLERLAEAVECQAWELLVDGPATREAALRKLLGGS